MPRPFAWLRIFNVRNDPMNGDPMALEKTQHYNKAIAAAAVTVLAFVAEQFGFEIPAEVQGSLITLAVFAIPNR